MGALRKAFPHPATRYVAERTTLRRLEGRIAAWRALAARAVEPNPFYGPEYLLASARHLEQEELRCIAVWRDGAGDSDLLGLFPLQRARIFDGALFPALEFYRNDYTCSTAPLVDKDDPVGVWEAFLDRCDHSPDQPQALLSRLAPTGQPCHAALLAALAARGLPHETVEAFERAAVLCPERFETAFRRMSGSRRSDIGRRRRKLRATGAVTFATVGRDGDVQGALETFLALEASGWKGEAGTALACQPATDAFARAAFSAENIEFDILAVDGRPIGVVASLVSAGALYTVKTAYDEAYANYAPGMLLCTHIMRRTAGNPAYVRLDSCAQATDGVNGYWLDREPVATIAFATSRSADPARIHRLAVFMRSAKRLKGWLKEQMAKRR